MVTTETGALSGAQAFGQTTAWIAATDAVVGIDLSAAAPRGAVREALNQVVAVSFMTENGPADDRDGWRRSRVSLYEAANRWLWLASHRDATPPPEP